MESGISEPAKESLSRDRAGKVLPEDVKQFPPTNTEDRA